PAPLRQLRGAAMSSIIIRPHGFSVNGKSSGLLVAYMDDGTPLGWEEEGNWSKGDHVEKAASRLSKAAKTKGIKLSPKDAFGLLTEALAAARTAAEAPIDPLEGEADLGPRYEATPTGFVFYKNIL